MNACMHTADGRTHVKVLAVAMAGAVLVAIAGFNLRADAVESAVAGTPNGGVIKAGKPVAYSARGAATFR